MTFLVSAGSGMTKKPSILDELEQFLPAKDKELMVETRANHLISSAINFLRLLKENYSTEQYDELSKRFHSAIKNEDFKKFQRGIERLKESKKNQGKLI